MFHITNFKRDERGSTLVEYSIGVSVFVLAMFAVLEFGRALWTHNALTDAARQGARYAALHKPDTDANIKNLVVYGNADGGTKPIVPGLTTSMVQITRSGDFSVNSGTVTVKITGYQFQFVLPLMPAKINMPAYATTLTGESVGLIP